MMPSLWKLPHFMAAADCCQHLELYYSLCYLFSPYYSCVPLLSDTNMRALSAAILPQARLSTSTFLLLCSIMLSFPQALFHRGSVGSTSTHGRSPVLSCGHTQTPPPHSKTRISRSFFSYFAGNYVYHSEQKHQRIPSIRRG